MSVNSKRKMKLSSAMAAVNNTSDLKRKLVFSNVLAATEAENSSARSLATNKNKRVTLPGTKNLSKSTVLCSFVGQTTNTRDGVRGAPRGKPQVQNVSNTLVENITTTDDRETTDEMVDELSGSISGD